MVRRTRPTTSSCRSGGQKPSDPARSTIALSPPLSRSEGRGPPLTSTRTASEPSVTVNGALTVSGSFQLRSSTSTRLTRAVICACRLASSLSEVVISTSCEGTADVAKAPPAAARKASSSNLRMSNPAEIGVTVPPHIAAEGRTRGVARRSRRAASYRARMERGAAAILSSARHVPQRPLSRCWPEIGRANRRTVYTLRGLRGLSAPRFLHRRRAMDEHITYIGLDVHKETISSAVANNAAAGRFATTDGRATSLRPRSRAPACGPAHRAG